MNERDGLTLDVSTWLAGFSLFTMTALGATATLYLLPLVQLQFKAYPYSKHRPVLLKQCTPAELMLVQKNYFRQKQPKAEHRFRIMTENHTVRHGSPLRRTESWGSAM